MSTSLNNKPIKYSAKIAGRRLGLFLIEQYLCASISFYALYSKANLLTLQNKQHNMATIEELTETIVKFRDERDWAQFHNAKDLSLALSIEAAELNQLFLWKSPEEANVEKIKEELADVLNYALLIANKYNFDVAQIILDKIEKNAQKYPVEKAKGTAKKYNEL